MLSERTHCDVSIIIVNWNTSDLLAACLRSLPAAISAVVAETIVVDNGSSDGSVERIRREFPWVRVIVLEANVGFARANNIGIRAAHGRYLFLLNSDTVLPPKGLDLLISFADEHPRVGIVGPRLAWPDGRAQPSWAAFPTLWSEARGVNVRKRRRLQASGDRHAHATDWIMGAAMLCRRELLANVGLLDEGFFMYSEEVDLCMRARRMGWLVCVLDDVTVVHVGGGSASRNDLRQLQLLYENKIRFFAKHRGEGAAMLLRMILVFSTFFGIVRRAVAASWRRDRRQAEWELIRVRWRLLRDLATGRRATTINIPVSGIPALSPSAASSALQGASAREIGHG